MTTPPLPRSLRWIAANPARTAVIVSVALMVYQACLPQGLTLDASARTFEWRVFPTEGFSIIWADVVGNVVPYWLFGHFVFVASWRNHSRMGRAWRVTLAGTMAMVMTVEAIQLLNPIRGSAMWDLLSGAIGATIALGTGSFYAKIVAGELIDWARSEAERRPVGLAAVAVAAYVLIDAAKPFHVISSANLLWDNIKGSNLIPFRPLGADIRDQLHIALGSHVPQPLPAVERTLDYWGSQLEMLVLSIGLLGLLAFGRRNKSLLLALVAWAVVLLGAEGVRLVIVGGHADVTHLVLGAMGAPLAVWGARAFERRRQVGLIALVGLFAGYVVISDLRPFLLGPAQSLSPDMLIPLIHHYRDIDVTQLWNLVESVLVYVPVGAALYASTLYRRRRERLSAWPWAGWSVLPCASIALGLEIAQIWIPSRVPHIEDVLLAMLGGWVGVSAVKLLAALHSGSSAAPDDSRAPRGAEAD